MNERQKNGATIRAAESLGQKDASMARYRYQGGSVKKRGRVWVGIYREDVVLPDGKVKRIQRKPVLGTIKEIPTEKLAKRVLSDRFLTAINDPSYRARPTATFAEFSARWIKTVQPNHAASSGASERSEIAAWVKAMGSVQLKDIGEEMVQGIVTGWAVSPKTVRNRLATLRGIFKTAKSWKYVGHNPCLDIELPDYCPPDQPCRSKEETMQIMALAEPQYRVVCWMFAETGIRRGEMCGLDVGHVALADLKVTARRSRWGSVVGNTKSKRPRVFSISPQLGEALRPYMEGRPADAPLFLSSKGFRLHPENLVKRKLKPILEKLGLKGGAHAFRHGNATMLDSLKVPMKVRQERLGHVHANTTLGYTHMVSQDDRKASGAMGKMLSKAVQ